MHLAIKNQGNADAPVGHAIDKIGCAIDGIDAPVIRCPGIQYGLLFSDGHFFTEDGKIGQSGQLPGKCAMCLYIGPGEQGTILLMACLDRGKPWQDDILRHVGCQLLNSRQQGHRGHRGRCFRKIAALPAAACNIIAVARASRDTAGRHPQEMTQKPF